MVTESLKQKHNGGFTSFSSASIDLIILSNSSLSLFSTTFLIDPNSAFDRWTSSTSSCCYKKILVSMLLSTLNISKCIQKIITIMHLSCWRNEKLMMTRCRSVAAHRFNLTIEPFLIE